MPGPLRPQDFAGPLGGSPAPLQVHIRGGVPTEIVAPWALRGFPASLRFHLVAVIMCAMSLRLTRRKCKTRLDPPHRAGQSRRWVQMAGHQSRRWALSRMWGTFFSVGSDGRAAKQ